MDVEAVMRETAAGWVKGKVPAAIPLPGPLEPTYTIPRTRRLYNRTRQSQP